MIDKDFCERTNGLINATEGATSMQLIVRPCIIGKQVDVGSQISGLLKEVLEAQEELRKDGSIICFGDKNFDIARLQHLREELVDIITYTCSILHALPFGDDGNVQEMVDFVAMKNTLRGRTTGYEEIEG